jgi:hypothetical protein
VLQAPPRDDEVRVARLRLQFDRDDFLHQDSVARPVTRLPH